jgi:hypothetical protein
MGNSVDVSRQLSCDSARSQDFLTASSEVRRRLGVCRCGSDTRLWGSCPPRVPALGGPTGRMEVAVLGLISPDRFQSNVVPRMPTCSSPRGTPGRVPAVSASPDGQIR